jgi:outer membrane receptor protein involved in Fe transport
VPVAVTAFTADSLDKLNVKDLADLDGQVPNLTIYAARGSSSTLTAYIRGVGQSDPLWGVDPGVGIYMDDVYIARPQGALLDVFDVDRIEVLRGPQGTLYGKNTIGGAIKYISKGLRSDFNGYGSVTLGNYGQRDIKAALGGRLRRQRIPARPHLGGRPAPRRLRREPGHRRAGQRQEGPRGPRQPGRLRHRQLRPAVRVRPCR